MPYRGDVSRIRQNARTVFYSAGKTGTWRHWVSADSGNPSVGIGAEHFYRENIVTAILADKTEMEAQRGGGIILGGKTTITTNVPFSSRDEFVFGGITYNVISDPDRSTLTNLWEGILERGQD